MKSMSKHKKTLGFFLLVYVVVVAAYTVYDRRPLPWTLVRGLYDGTTLVMPIVFVGFAGFRVFRRRSISGVLALAFLLFGIRVWATHIEPKMLKVREVTIVSDKISSPLRIAHISDIQSADVGDYEARALRTVKALAPDIVIHTGDILQTQDMDEVASELAKVEALLVEIDAPLGRYHVTGDTDWRIQDRYATFAGFKTLDDDSFTIERGDDRIRLFGVKPRHARRPKAAAKVIAKWRAEDPDAFNIAYAHPPDFVLGLEDEPVDLCLAGHTHGGQIRVPFFGPIVTASEVPRHLARGFHEWGATRINTSAGIGAEHIFGMPSLRINCPPEITIITVLPKRLNVAA